LLALLAILCVAVGVARLARGIGAVTNLSNGYPWGIWIAFDDVVGTALASSGFAVATATFILNRGEFHPMVRPALLTSLFGSVLALVSVTLDLGRYWNAWHIMLPRFMQLHSVLFEVARCMAIYTLIVFVELLPVLFEKFQMKRANRIFDHVFFFVVALAALVTTMQQSSLGSMLVVFGPLVHPLYQTQMLPLLFLVSTFGMGLAAVTLEATLSASALHRPRESDLLFRLMKVGRGLILLFLILRFADLLLRGTLHLLAVRSTAALAFWTETALFVASVLLLLGHEAHRLRRIFIAAMCMALGGIMYRLDAYLIAYGRGPDWRYFPSMGELGLTIGLVAFEILGFIVAIHILPIMPAARDPRR
jgi:Ni/Fe-hydrogenase subunit HybB-like protein